MGSNPTKFNDKDVFYTGNMPHDTCMQIFDSADWMLHLAWLDHCPNTVIEAISRGLPVICSEDGGTKEIVKNFGIILKEKKTYSFELTNYENPPELDVFQIKNLPNKESLGNPLEVSIYSCAKEYISFFSLKFAEFI